MEAVVLLVERVVVGLFEGPGGGGEDGGGSAVVLFFFFFFLCFSFVVVFAAAAAAVLTAAAAVVFVFFVVRFVGDVDSGLLFLFLVVVVKETGRNKKEYIMLGIGQ